MLAMNVIKPDQIERASPLVFTPKEDSNLRFYLDYRKLNSVDILDLNPLPRMDERIDSLGDSQVFSTLDGKSVNGRLKWPFPPVRRQYSLFTLGYTNSLVCHSV